MPKAKLLSYRKRFPVREITVRMNQALIAELEEEAGERLWPFDRLLTHAGVEWLQQCHANDHIEEDSRVEPR